MSMPLDRVSALCTPLILIPIASVLKRSDGKLSALMGTILRKYYQHSRKPKPQLIKPTMIVAKTFKGKGVSFLEDADNWHGKALAKGEELDKALAELGPLNLDVPVQIESPPAVDTNANLSKTECEPPDYPPDEDVATRGGYGVGLAKLGSANPNVVALGWRYQELYLC